MKMILNFESNTQTPLVFTFLGVLRAFNIKDDTLYISSSFKRFLSLYLRNWKMFVKEC